MIGNSSNKSGGCGCGGSASLSVAPCSCGGGGCASCQGQGIVRPSFFAGQLLTEDDLQLLTDYAVQKNRLHNRLLFGDGVVCGLEVSCHPCGDGQVIVHPGYALDCCGNDLTLACAQTLDVKAMIRDLRRDRLGGYDCGDPCPDPSKLATQVTNPAVTYCLYLSYCEQPSDPVMPYSTGDDCGRLACEPTRVREGVKFELRCKPTGDAANALLERLCRCLGDLDKLKNIIKLVLELRDKTAIVTTISAPPSHPFSVQEFSAYAQTNTAFQTALNSVLASSTAATSAAPQSAAVTSSAAASSAAVSTTVQQATLFSDVREVATFIDAFERFDASAQASLLKDHAVMAQVTQARAAIQKTVAMVAQDSRSQFSYIRDWLIERLNDALFLSDCTLRQRVFAMALPVFSETDRSTATIISSTIKPLIEAFFSYLRDCLCRAINPACEPCDDTGVLLACLEVEDCNVVRICNLERRFVLSPAAVRYWLPPLQLIGNIAERLCCAPFESLLTLNAERTTKEFNFDQLLKSEIERMLKDSLCGFAGNVDSLGDLLNQIWQMFHPPSAKATRSTAGVAGEIFADKGLAVASNEEVAPGAEVAAIPESASLRVNGPAAAKAKIRFAPRKRKTPKAKAAAPKTSEVAGGEEAKSEQPK